MSSHVYVLRYRFSLCLRFCRLDCETVWTVSFFFISSSVTEYTRYSVHIGQALYEWQACAVIPFDTKRITTLYLCMNNDHDKKEPDVDTITLSTYTIGAYRH